MKTSKFGKVVFNETGIAYEIPYAEPDWNSFGNHNDLSKVLDIIKALVAGRLQSCINNLEKNFSNIIGSTNYGIVFFADGTHFSKPTAEAMQRVANVKYLHSLDGVMIAQAIKACVNPKIVTENREIVPANFSETELKLVIDLLIETQIVYQQCFTKAEMAGMEQEFHNSLKSGLSPEEILREWDL